VDWGEDIVAAATRELAEETGLTWVSLDRLIGVYSHAERDPRFHSVCVALSAQVAGEMTTRDADEVSDIRAFTIDELPIQQLAHDHTRQLEDYLAGKTVLA
jgi:8-oxo-dGTP diphosphatase